uniref:Uncharacterized protein n=1 Tax=Cryptosporidium parvum TaxID=5807 RepID=F0X554_CRYPV
MILSALPDEFFQSKDEPKLLLEEFSQHDHKLAFYQVNLKQQD